MKRIEEHQKQEFAAPSDEEIILEACLKTLAELAVNIPHFKSEVEEKTSQLVRLKQERLQKHQQRSSEPLPETGEKAQLRKKIKEIEDELLKQIQLVQFIRFSNLEDPNFAISCFERLSEIAEKVRINPSLHLNVRDKAFLDDLFEKDLMLMLDYKVSHSFESFETFSESVTNSSLIT